MKIFIDPNPEKCANRSGGVNNVVCSTAAHLMLRGFEIVRNAKDADVTIGHALANALDHYDIAYTHGLYPTNDYEWEHKYKSINNIIFRNILRAKRVVTCSEWTADIIKWYFHINPVVIPNGLDLNDYKPSGNKNGSILWGKTSVNPVCDPEYLIQTARLLPDKSFISMCKLPYSVPNITCYEGVNPKRYKELLSKCSIYLGTVKENSPIGQMEALALGLPIVGFEWGWNKETLRDSRGALLVPPGNVRRLSTAINFVISHWDEFHQDALDTATKFDINPSIDKLEALCKEVFAEKLIKNKVSIVIPNHNYGNFVSEAIESALNQTIPAEVIVVDDCSTDNSKDIIKKYPKVTFIENAKNIGVSESRNKGIFFAKGNLIVCLDADDILEKDFCEILSKKFAHNGIAVAYAPINLISEKGFPYKKTWFESVFDFTSHIAGNNQIPSCCMFRKEWWLRAGKYKKEFEYCEDAELWTSIAKLSGEFVFVPGKPLMNYRLHAKQKTKTLQHNTKWKTELGRIRDNTYSSFEISEGGIKEITFRMFYTNEPVSEIEKTIRSIEKLQKQNWIILIEGNSLPAYLFKEYPFVETKRSWKTQSTSIIPIKIGDEITENIASECVTYSDLLWSEL